MQGRRAEVRPRQIKILHSFFFFKKRMRKIVFKTFDKKVYTSTLLNSVHFLFKILKSFYSLVNLAGY